MGDNRPIGIFDSGVGGLTVVKALLQRLPEESFVYFGDTAHVPYGSKTREQLFKYAEDILAFLHAKEVKAIVVACGTHSSVTLPVLQEHCTVPMLGVVKPGSQAGAQASKNGKIGIIATQATVNSKAYVQNIKDLNSDYQVFQTACSRFVPLVESGMLQSEEAREAVEEYLGPLLQQGIDTLVMGCTHYPFLSPLMKDYIGPDVSLVDPAIETVEELARILVARDMLNEQDGQPAREFYVSGNDHSFLNVGRLLLGEIIQKVERVSMDE